MTNLKANEVLVAGRLTADPELKTGGNTQYCWFGLAVEEEYTKPNAEKKVDFINVTVFAKTAEYLANYGSKGDLVLVKARLGTRKVKDTNRTEITVLGNSIQLVACKKFDEKAAAKKNGGGNSVPASAGSQTEDFAELDDDDGDLPF